MAELDYSEILTVDGEKYDPLVGNVFRFYLVFENGEDITDSKDGRLGELEEVMKGVGE